MGNSPGGQEVASESINHTPARSIEAARDAASTVSPASIASQQALFPAASSQQSRPLTADHIVVRVAVCRRVVGH